MCGQKQQLPIRSVGKINHQHVETHTHACGHRTAPALRSMTVSSRPDRCLWFEAVQPTASRCYLPDGPAWLGVILARSLSVCFSVCFSLAHLLLPRPPPCMCKNTLYTHIRREGVAVLKLESQWDVCAPCWHQRSHRCQCCVTCMQHERQTQQLPSSSHMPEILYNRCASLLYLLSSGLLAMWEK